MNEINMNMGMGNNNFGMNMNTGEMGGINNNFNNNFDMNNNMGMNNNFGMNNNMVTNNNMGMNNNMPMNMMNIRGMGGMNNNFNNNLGMNNNIGMNNNMGMNMINIPGMGGMNNNFNVNNNHNMGMNMNMRAMNNNFNNSFRMNNNNINNNDMNMNMNVGMMNNNFGVLQNNNMNNSMNQNFGLMEQLYNQFQGYDNPYEIQKGIVLGLNNGKFYQGYSNKNAPALSFFTSSSKQPNFNSNDLDYVNVVFVTQKGNSHIRFYNRYMKIHDMLVDFITNMGLNEKALERIQFLYNATLLNNLKNTTLIQFNINNHSKINVIDIHNVIGA